MKRFLTALLFILAAPGAVFGAEPSVKLGQTVQSINLNLSRVAFSQAVTVADGPADCPRCFVGIYASSAPTAVRLQWAYLDGTKNNTSEALKTRKLTGSTLIFLDLFLSPSASYEARFYHWKPDQNHLLLATIPIMQPIAKIERRTLATEGATVTRHPLGNRDEVIITRKDGAKEHITMDRGVLFEITPVLGTSEPHIPVVSEP